MRFCEIEFKYYADNIKLSDFVEFCNDRKPEGQILVSGYDYFYEKPNEDAFCRLRVGPDSNQLTFKRKLTSKNNFIRTEHNIDLESHITKDQITALCKEFGYMYNMTLFKNCFIYHYDWYTFVYYICYDENMKEIGRFVEIEMSEDHSWIDEQHAWNELIILEKTCRELGISPQCRVKKSLFELFKKELKDA